MTGQMDFLQRFIVTVFLCVVIRLLFFIPIPPLVRVKPVDFEADFKKETKKPEGNICTKKVL
jgi:hypothetical protein